jgi:hypothetical protein
MLVGDLGTVRIRRRVFSVLAWGTRVDNVWKGWLSFFADDGTVFRTGAETVQPNLDALVYWASGLRVVYLEGALARAEEVPAAQAGAPPLEAAEVVTAPDTTVDGTVDDEDATAVENGPALGEAAGIVQVLAVDPAFGRCTVRAGDRVIVLDPQPAVALGVRVGDRFWLRRPRAA